MAEEFGFEQILRIAAVLIATKGLSARGCAGAAHADQFLAGTGFAGDHYRGVRLGKTPDGAEDFLHRGACPESRGRFNLLICTNLVHRLVERSPDQLQRLIDVEGLGRYSKARPGRPRRPIRDPNRPS